MSIMTVTTRVSHKWYMRKRRDEIIDCIKELHEQLNLGKPDLPRFNHWDKYALAWEALKLHQMLPEDAPTKTFEVTDEVLKQLRQIRRKCWAELMDARKAQKSCTIQFLYNAYEQIADSSMKYVQALNLFFPETGDTAERDYELWKKDDGNQCNQEKP